MNPEIVAVDASKLNEALDLLLKAKTPEEINNVDILVKFDRTGDSLLHWFVYEVVVESIDKGMSKITRLFQHKDSGLLLCQSNNRKLTPLMLAIKYQNKALYDFFVQRGVYGSEFIDMLYHEIQGPLNSSALDILKDMLSISEIIEILNSDTTTENPVTRAIMNKDFAAMVLLLDAGISPLRVNENGLNAFHAAAADADGARFLERLLQHPDAEKGLDQADSSDRIPLAYALVKDISTEEMEKKAEMILSKSNIKKVFSNGMTMVHLVIGYNKLTALSFLLNYIKDKAWLTSVEAGVNKLTPLMQAACSGKKEAVALLLENNADPNYVNSKGMTALSIAREFKKTDIQSLLSKTSASGMTDLMQAVLEDDRSSVVNFLNQGEDPNEENELGESAMSIALKRENFRMAASLLAGGFSWVTLKSLCQSQNISIERVLEKMSDEQFKSFLVFRKMEHEKEKEMQAERAPKSVNIPGVFSI